MTPEEQAADGAEKVAKIVRTLFVITPPLPLPAAAVKTAKCPRPIHAYDQSAPLSFHPLMGWLSGSFFCRLLGPR